MTPCSLCFLFALSSSLCASAGGLSALLLSAALSLLFFPLLSFRIAEKALPLRLLAAVSFVLRLYALLSCVRALQTGWRAVFLSLAALLTVVLQLGGTDERASRPAIPLLFAVSVVCWSSMVGGTPVLPPTVSAGASFAPALLSALVCPLSSALSLTRGHVKAVPSRLLLLLFAALGCGAALPSFFFRGVFGTEACALVALPFCASHELRALFCEPALPAYTENKNAKGTPCSSEKPTAPQTASPCPTRRAKRNSKATTAERS